MITWMLRSATVEGPSITAIIHSHAVICPHCGEVWARVYLAGRNHGWRGTTLPCEACPPWEYAFGPPGSLIGVIPTNDLLKLPVELLKRELLIHLNYFEKGVRNESTERV